MPFSRAALAVLPCFLWACSGVSPTPGIGRVTPKEAYSDQEIKFTIIGWSFVPATAMDPATGQRDLNNSGFSGRVGFGTQWAPLSQFVWYSTQEMSATLSEADARMLNRGTFSLEITDPRGVKAVASIILDGLDTTPPTIEMLSPAPDDRFTSGSVVPLRVHVTDPAPGILTRVGWRLFADGLPEISDSCILSEDQGDVVCQADLTIPADWLPPTKVTLEIQAQDQSRTREPATLTRRYQLVPSPSDLTISPTRGGTMGGTEVIIKGVSLVKGTRALLNGVPLLPQGGLWVNDQTLTGQVPENSPGKVTLTIESPLGNCALLEAFEYRPTPMLLAIEPASGPPNQSVRLIGTGFTAASRILFGHSLQDALPLSQSPVDRDTAITGKVPSGSGWQTVWVYDPEFGFSSLPSGFLFTSP